MENRTIMMENRIALDSEIMEVGMMMIAILASDQFVKNLRYNNKKKSLKFVSAIYIT